MKRIIFMATLLPVLWLAACSRNKSDMSSADVYSEAADSVSVTGLQGDSIKLVKTASVDFKVKDVYKASTTITATARLLGGMITHHNILTEVQQNKELKISADSLLRITSYMATGEIVAKVPTEELDEFMAAVYDLSTFINTSNLEVDDQSLQYLEGDLKQKSREKILSAVVLKPSDTKSTEQLISQHDNLIDKNIANRQISANTKFSSVQLKLYQDPLIMKEKTVNNDLSNYKMPISSELKDAFLSGWNYFMSLIVVLTHLWMFILLGLAFWLIFRYYKQKKAFNLLPK